MEILLWVFKRYIEGNKNRLREIQRMFFAFKQKTDDFSINNPCWVDREYSYLFWMSAYTVAPGYLKHSDNKIRLG